MRLDPHCYEYRERAVTPQRRAAARRAIDREKNRLPLFAHEITMTVEERIEQVDEGTRETKRKLRRWYARQLCRLRLVWRSIPVKDRATLAAEWESSTYPKTASYALEWLKRRGYLTMRGYLSEDGKEWIVEVAPCRPPT